MGVRLKFLKELEKKWQENELMKKNKQNREWFSIPEAAEILSVCRSTLHRWVLEDRFADAMCWRLGRNWRINQQYVFGLKSGKLKLLPRQKRVYPNVNSDDGSTGDMQSISA